jgi:hypothetical protein
MHAWCWCVSGWIRCWHGTFKLESFITFLGLCAGSFKESTYMEGSVVLSTAKR